MENMANKIKSTENSLLKLESETLLNMVRGESLTAKRSGIKRNRDK